MDSKIFSIIELEEKKIYLRKEILKYCKFIYNKDNNNKINFSLGPKEVKISKMKKNDFITFLKSRFAFTNHFGLLNKEITIKTIKKILKFQNLTVINPHNNNISNSDFDSDFINDIYKKCD